MVLRFIVLCLLWFLFCFCIGVVVAIMAHEFGFFVDNQEEK